MLTNIFQNPISKKIIKKAIKQQKKYIAQFGDDKNTTYHLGLVDNPVVTPTLGIKILTSAQVPLAPLPEKSVIIGNIRMGFGHYRISMAMASAAQSMGYTPIWLDLNSFPSTTGTKIISHLNDLYSLGSRLSQKFSLFNTLYWEPLNKEGFRKLSYNAGDQIVAELMTPILSEINKNTPYIATHAWPSQAAIHGGFTKVVNAIPDNWPMALHLSEGALHSVQTPSSYFGYKNLVGMDGEKILHPMGEKDIIYSGHYIDHEIVDNIEEDCKKRINRITSKQPLRFLFTVGGAGAQGAYFIQMIKSLLPYVQKKQLCLYINFGDHKNVLDALCKELPQINNDGKKHYNNWTNTQDFCQKAIQGDDNESGSGIHLFYHEDIFAAVYSTNLLMRASDVLITKPSELAFYPIPKLHIKRVGGHEMWGAVHSAEIGDGTPECSEVERAIFTATQMIEHPFLIQDMCKHILENKEKHIYDGAYVAVKAAIEG